MQYGYFDDDRREYVITRPDTPKSWSNYLGTTEYGAIITNNAGGYGFYKSGGMGRFIRMRFNSIPMDQPGRYVYLRDRDTGDYWSVSWQPVGKPLESFKSECRHGMGYTIISSLYSGIEAETTYFVPLGKLYEIWKVKVTNKGNSVRKLSAFTYLEYAANWNAMDDLLNIQYTHYTAQMKVIDGIIDHGTNVYIPEMPDNFKEKDQGRHTFMALAGADVVGFETDRERFLGPYRTYANPITVEQGKCSNFEAWGDNPCGTLQADIELKPGETRTFLVLVGIGKASVAGKQALNDFHDLAQADRELEQVKAYWHQRMEGIRVETPDREFDSMINTWIMYNCLVTFAWSRSASLIYTGIDRDGLGYRDTVQDLLGVFHAIPDEARERLELMITGQVSTGGCMPVILPVSHSPGRENPPAEEDYRSDDALWLFNAVPAYVNETGDIGFYRKVLPYADKGSDPVWKHLKQAIQFSLDRSGAHGLPCGLKADWNDCLKFGHNGESGFVALQLRYALREYIQIAHILQLQEEENWAENILKELDRNIQNFMWDGEWFLRGYRYDGMKFGSSECSEGKIYLNTQSWAVLSGAATPEQAALSMQKVNELLATDYGIMICTPPYTETDYNIVRAALMNPGMKENGGIFTHIQGWAVMAETMLGNGNRAYQYFRAYMPAAYNNKAEIREIEPYVLCQSTHSKFSPRYGASRIPWLTGSATWTMVAASQYILGIRPALAGIQIDPCIPSAWESFHVIRRFRGKVFDIQVNNPNHTSKGIKSILLNGKKMEGNLIPFEQALPFNKVTVEMA